jgi:holliday junction DNA helicase RuvB
VKGGARRGGRTPESSIVVRQDSVQVPAVTPGEDDFDRSLRPPRLDDFIGQEELKDQLELFITAARKRGEPLDHVLLAGPPGLGKTSLAHIVARELDAPLVQTAGPALERKGDVAAFLTAL